MHRKLWSSFVFLGLLVGNPCFGNGDGSETSWIKWSAGEAESSLALARVLLNSAREIREVQTENLSLQSELTSAACKGSMLRPGNGLGPIVDKDNAIHCLVQTKSQNWGRVSLDLSKTEIHRWGNSFFPRGISIKDELAQKLYQQMMYFHGNESNDTPVLERNEVGLTFPGGRYDFIDYRIIADDLAAVVDLRDARRSLVCTEEFVYPDNEYRPSGSSRIRCDFIYMHEAGI